MAVVIGAWPTFWVKSFWLNGPILNKNRIFKKAGVWIHPFFPISLYSMCWLRNCETTSIGIFHWKTWVWEQARMEEWQDASSSSCLQPQPPRVLLHVSPGYPCSANTFTHAITWLRSHRSETAGRHRGVRMRSWAGPRGAHMQAISPASACF